MKRDPYTVPDPLATRWREFTARVLICPVLGHDRPAAFGGGAKPCCRCGR